MFKEPWIQTYTGLKLHPLSPSKNEINIKDIAHSLSMMCRFNGHVKSFYSVAQHSLLVSLYCKKEFALWGLLHDASEFAIADLASPIKHSGAFENYKVIEKTLQKTICEKFNLPIEEPPNIKEIDQKLLATEARDLMSPLHPDWKCSFIPFDFKIIPMPQEEAEASFLRRFEELTL